MSQTPATERKSRLLALATAVPDNAYAQGDLAEALLQLVPLPAPDAQRLRRLALATGIKTRYSVLPDYGGLDKRILFPPSPDYEPTPGLEARMACFHEQAPPLALKAIEQAFAQAPGLRERVSHLIAVTCTGIAAPGLDLMLMRALELPPQTHRTAVHFMGCYAAMHGLKQAAAICEADPKALVLVVCVELCSLHFQKDPSIDNLAATLLFADGAAAALIGGADVPRAHLSQAPLRLDGFYSEVALAGWQDMAWQLSPQGFLMRLSSYVPELLRQGMRQLVSRALERLGLDLAGVDHWAIHPGGRKILDLAAEELELPQQAFWASYQVLRRYGNMSSPTVLFVLKALSEGTGSSPGQAPPRPGERVFAAAFGPGLTMETLVGCYED